MTKEFKEKWIEALRSGEYQQGKSYLSFGGGYCCLGVACRVAGISDEEMENDELIYDEDKYANLPTELKEGRTGTWKHDYIKTLTYMNDGHAGMPQASFPEIANWIEENIKTEEDEIQE